MSLGTKFSENFWDEQVSGYMVLYQNLRHSRQTIKELESFLREASSVEDQYQKQLGKICQSMGKFNPESSSAPLWLAVLKEISELNCVSHSKFVTKVAELIKQVQSYGSELHVQKNKFKQAELTTVQLIEQFRSSKAQLFRAKHSYVQVASELEKQKKILEHTQPSNPGSNQLLVQKLEKKLSSLSGAYNSCIDGYNSIRDQLEIKFNSSCDQFEQMERAHLEKIKHFLAQYLQLVDNLNVARSKNFTDCHHKFTTHTIENLLEQFLLNKSIGKNRPSRAEFVQFGNLTRIDTNAQSKSPNFWHVDILSKIRPVKKKRADSAYTIEPYKTDSGESSIARAASLDSIDFHVSTPKKTEADMVNYYESEEEAMDKAWMKSSDSSDDESDDSDMQKKIYLKINPVKQQPATSPDQLNQIGKNLQLKLSMPAKKVYTKSYKMDENNNLAAAESVRGDQPPPLPPMSL